MVDIILPFMSDGKIMRSICITTNISCNLNCTYCYEHDKSDKSSFDVDTAKRTIAALLSKPTEKGTYINFHGGEPFISFKKIKELCEWTWAQHFPEKFIFFATSNGTLIHGEIKEWLTINKDRFVVGLSLDGTREMHNINRSNSFDLIDIDFIISTWPFQTVKMTVSPHTITHLSEGIIYMHERAIKKIAVNLAEMIDWSLPKYEAIYREELQKLSLYYQTHPSIEPCSLFNIKFQALLDDTQHKWCGVGTSMTAYDTAGNSYPCHLFLKEVCGVEKAEKSKLINFNDPKEYTDDLCSECPLIKICPTCYGANYISRGDVRIRDKSICRLHKVRFAVVANYQYQNIVEGNCNIEKLSDKEKYSRIRILDGIEKLSNCLNL